MMKQPAAPAPDTANLKAAAITSVTMLFYASNDMTCKMVMARLPVPETLAFRNGLTVLGTAAIAGPSALREIATLSRRDAKALLARTSCDITLTTCFLISLAELPLANAAAVLQIAPLIIVLGGAVFFGERVGPVDWLLSIIGFIGALIIIRPGARCEGFNAFSLWLVAAAFAGALRDLLSRTLSDALAPSTVALSSSTGVLLWSLGWLALTSQAYVRPSAFEVWLLVATAGSLLTANVLAVVMMRSGNAAFGAPFRYTLLLWATLLQAAFFGAWPDSLTCIGGGVILCAGLAALHREGRRRTVRAAPKNSTHVAPAPTRAKLSERLLELEA
ncbi:hypothetical protein EMIHUDRAFT_199399 [Emiliania huxleyi CCMP1516]|uniref:EamA domain-containing protein n=2 Tax=Emiliania huxleyi TaxID=2903 RepID=A0A0D3KZI7_EMIH1|nr:hypothetical protein EMIHUDRAFT_199399 [Emiliania huxleyi CCMP1516]EOD41172.1 hypothetical protein EMIHUDRAFT_199399 [Emiliania huxleyi CCMP1516]|eukprot:XP_005793601.1 hypothetical protein EMIHUDRAFT_199399 [Emiliania huxleyi CCMP1516]